MYVYESFESGVYTVGHYTPQGEWIPESDHTKSNQAADRVYYLHGGTNDSN